MTYNIKNDSQKEGLDCWNNRKVGMIELLHKYQPNVLGVQEALHNQVEYLDSCLIDYSYVGVGRDDGKQMGEYCAIFYDKTKYEVLKEGTFWLSPTPDTARISWDAACTRICTYVLLKGQTSNEQFWVFNAHFDHVGKKARKQSSKMLLKKIRDSNMEGYPVILMGDLNATPDKRSIGVLSREMVDAYNVIEGLKVATVGTYNGFRLEPSIKRIDYVFVKNLEVVSYVHIDERRDNNRHISDHLPVMVTVRLL
ncbi:endonuclease/exonuclease/phosphatase family protein [Labilibacter sediminis]|nr:endonuclease/exonuclease/phosphatase family protein [Labilibacter sediminis]